MEHTPYPPIPRESKLAMAWIVMTLSRAVNVGTPCEYVKTLQKRLLHPQPGDLVYEWTTLFQLLKDLEDDRWDGQFVPYLRTEMVPYYQDEDGIWHDEEAHFCLNPDGTEFKWTNAALNVVPNNRSFL